MRHESILDLIGDTPLVGIHQLSPNPDVRIYAKLEGQNPGGSAKDRIARKMVELAEADGTLRPGATILEPSSGNTGIGLALVCAVKGYRLILTMPDTMSEERRSLLRGYGAELELTPDTKGMHAAVERAEEIARSEPRAFLPQQFRNPANPDAHRRTTAVEILEQFPRIDAFVAGVGTGGTITGVGDVLHRERPGCRVVAVEPASSAVLSGGKPGYHKIQGIGAGFVPENLDPSSYDDVIAIEDADAAEHARRLAREEGLLVGISSGANCAAAVRVASALTPEHVVVTVFCDTGERYLTTDLFRGEEI